MELILRRRDAGVEDELFGCLQGDDLGAADGLLPDAVGQGDEWSGGRKRDHVKNCFCAFDHSGIEGKARGAGAAGHADGRGVDDQSRPKISEVGAELEAVLFGQRSPSSGAARNDVAGAEPVISQRCDDGLGHAAAAQDGEVAVGGNLMGGQNPCDCEVVGVVRVEVAVGVDDGVDGLDSRCGGVQLVDKWDDLFLVGHRHCAPPDAEGADPRDGAGDIGGREGLVEIIQSQLVVEEVVKSGADIARPGGQRNAHCGVTGNGPLPGSSPAPVCSRPGDLAGLARRAC